MVRQRGVTLIELMIGIALLAILAVAIFPLGRAWVANAQITKTEKEFLEAYSRAKNEALRNPNAVKDDDVDPTAASLVVDDGVVSVKDSSGDNVIWSFEIAPTVTITLSNGCTEQQVLLNNNAALLSESCTFYKVEATGGTYASGTL